MFTEFSKDMKEKDKIISEMKNKLQDTQEMAWSENLIKGIRERQENNAHKENGLKKEPKWMVEKIVEMEDR